MDYHALLLSFPENAVIQGLVAIFETLEILPKMYFEIREIKFQPKIALLHY